MYQHWGYGFWVRNEEGEKVLEFSVAMNIITMGNSTIKKNEILLVTYEYDPVKMQVDYCLLGRYQGKFVIDINIFPSEECATQFKYKREYI